jgi:arylsulfatase A-like enzyme
MAIIAKYLIQYRNMSFMTRFCLLVFSLVMAFVEETVAATKPNFIIFLVDDMGMMDTSVPFLTDEQGQPKKYPLNEYYRTPSMERLAAQGIRFNNFYAMSVCSPTRIAIMTGQNSARHQTTTWINPDSNNAGPNGPPDWRWTGLTKNDLTLARLLQSSGYRTIHVGKGHFGPRDHIGADPLNLGFDVNVAGASIGAPASYYGAENYGNRGKKAKSAVLGLDKYHGTDTFLTEALTLEANQKMADSVSEKKPFFLYLPHYAVHGPFNSDPRFADHYKDSGRPAPAQAFATLVEGMDRSLGMILDQVEKLGVAEDTLIFFLGDNGSDAPHGHEHAVACAAPLRGKKGSHYEGGVRVPFIAAWGKPNAKNIHQLRLPIGQGKIQPQLAAIYDIFPTILELIEIDRPSNHTFDGGGLRSLLTGQSDAQREQVFLMHFPHSPHRSTYFTSYREGDWKVIYHYFPSDVSEGGHYQLYQLAMDPFESTNVANSQPEKLKELMTKMIARLTDQRALYPVGEDKKPVLPKIP